MWSLTCSIELTLCSYQYDFSLTLWRRNHHTRSKLMLLIGTRRLPSGTPHCMPHIRSRLRSGKNSPPISQTSCSPWLFYCDNNFWWLNNFDIMGLDLIFVTLLLWYHHRGVWVNMSSAETKRPPVKNGCLSWFVTIADILKPCMLTASSRASHTRCGGEKPACSTVGYLCVVVITSHN